MKPYLLGQGMYSYVDGFFLSPYVYISSADIALPNLNMSYMSWKQQDQLIMVSLCRLCLPKCYILLLIAKHPMVYGQLLKLLLLHHLTMGNAMAPSKTRGRMIVLLVLICSKPICYLMSLLLLTCHCPWKILTSMYFVDWEENFRTQYPPSLLEHNLFHTLIFIAIFSHLSFCTRLLFNPPW